MPRSAPRLNSGAPAAEAENIHAAALTDPAQLFGRAADQPHLALAVSGGSDSMAMLCLVHQWVQEGAVPAISVLTVDHGLRQGSAAETQQVARWCSALGFPHHILRWEGTKPSTGLQAAARAARYELMTAWCLSHGVTMLLTAHTLDDQAETVAMRLKRTATDASLAGIWAERLWKATRLIRPLLGVRRATLRSYLKQRGQPWIEDPSNEQERFERVRVRRELAQKADGEIVALGQRAAIAAGVARSVLVEVDGFVAQHLNWHTAGYGEMDRAAFGRLGKAVQAAVIHHILLCFTACRPAPDSLSRLARWVVEGGAPRRSLGGALFSLRSRSLIFGREPGRISSQLARVPGSGLLVWDQRFQIRSRPQSLVFPAISLGQVAGPHCAPYFVRQGWPVVLDGAGRAETAEIVFKPCLR